MPRTGRCPRAPKASCASAATFASIATSTTPSPAPTCSATGGSIRATRARCPRTAGSTSLGRVIAVINHGGDKISPQAIEGVLLAQPGVADAAAFGVRDAEGMMEIWAAVVVEPTFEEDSFRRACGERLRAHAPKFFFKLDVLPRNAGGKVTREELVKLVLARRQPA